MGRERRGRARLPPLLLALLGLGPELLFGHARAAAPRPVHGVLGGSVLLAPALPPNRTVKEIEWSFSGGTGATIQVAEVGPGGFERPDPRDRFGRRLEPVNGTALRLRQLQRGDSGVFGARIKLQPALVDDQAFNLTVHEAVPSPRTRSQLLASTLHWCNLTLQCQGSGHGAVNVSWAWAEPGPAWHRLSPDGTTLRVALPPAATNVTYACTVSNPADSKVALFHLHSLCQGAGGHSAFSTSGYVVLALVLVAVSLGGAFWCWRVNSEKAARAAATPTAPPEESPGEPQYSDIVCRSPPEGNDQVPPPKTAGGPQKLSIFGPFWLCFGSVSGPQPFPLFTPGSAPLFASSSPVGAPPFPAPPAPAGPEAEARGRARCPEARGRRRRFRFRRRRRRGGGTGRGEGEEEEEGKGKANDEKRRRRRQHRQRRQQRKPSRSSPPPAPRYRGRSAPRPPLPVPARLLPRFPPPFPSSSSSSFSRNPPRSSRPAPPPQVRPGGIPVWGGGRNDRITGGYRSGGSGSG
uniref:uncharacterized protein n=1 Tax=Lonchura striata TaxID=40157 RepID=UPI000B4CDD63|nr:uncharacterized protein LOC110476884 [Lonchura striata domestica]